MPIKVNAPAVFEGRIVKILSISGSEAEVVWIGLDGRIEQREVWMGDLMDFDEATSPQSNWNASAEGESRIRAWRSNS